MSKLLIATSIFLCLSLIHIYVTYHREEYEFKELPNWLLQKKVVKKRPGTVGICAGIQNKYNVDAIPPVSYTHLDVYKRQWLMSWDCSWIAARTPHELASNI